MYVIGGFLYALQPIFYPIEAESRGAEPYHYGLVFGIYSLSSVIVNPFSGTLSVKIGIKKVICTGAIIESLCGFSFAFLSYSKDVSYFIGLSCLLRFIEGIAGAFRGCCAYGILMTVYPERVNS